MKRRLNLWVPTSVLLLVTVWTAAAGQIIYVDADANGLNDGSSWPHAFKYLQDALLAASSGSEIRVAGGIYKPDQGATVTAGDRAATFQLNKNRLIVKGGYGGLGEPDPNAIDIGLYESVLSGDLDGNDVEVSDPCKLLTDPSRAENSYHVLTTYSTGPTTVLDGFTIRGGRADGPWENRCGGGILSTRGYSPKLTNCTITENSAYWHGGGMYSFGFPTLTNCTFARNYAGFMGGGAWCNIYYVYNEDATLTDCEFIGNYAGVDGGGMYSAGCLILTGTSFIENYAGRWGGGMHNVTIGREIWRRLTVTRCVFTRNSGNSGGGLSVHGGNYTYDPIVINCKFIENSTHPGNLYNAEGGGVSTYESSAEITNCAFWGNHTNGDGGGLYNERGSPTLTNCVFTANSAKRGGGMYSEGEWRYSKLGIISYCDSCPRLINCTFTENRAYTRGGGMYNDYRDCCEAYLTNCIFWRNRDNSGKGEQAQIYGEMPMVICSCIEDDDPNDEHIAFNGIYVHRRGTGYGNIDDNPIFLRRANDGGDGWSDDPCTPDIDEGANDNYGHLYLRIRSPCIDAGDNSVLVPSPGRDGRELPPVDIGDLDGRSRLIDGNGDGSAITDMGAYEFLPGDFDINGSVNLRDFAIFGSGWLAEVANPNWNAECDVSVRANNRIDMLDLAIVFEHWVPGK